MKITAAEIADSPIEVIGALDYDIRADGISPRRLPDWTRPQVPQMMDVMARMPAGVRLAFVTDSPVIKLHVQTTTMVTPPRNERPVAFDLVTEGEVQSAIGTGGNRIILDPGRPEEFELVRGDAYTVTFEPGISNETAFELWLPHNAFVELRGIEFAPGAKLGAPPAPRHRWAHYGSSISHCMEALQPTGTWPAVASRVSGWSLVGMGFGGQCHLDQFVARTLAALDVDLISIKTGINVVNMDSMRERTFVPAIHGFLDTIRERKPTMPIIIASPIFCPSAESAPGPTIPNARGKFVTLPGHDEIQAGCLTLRRIREVLEEVVSKRVATGDQHLAYLDGLNLFGEDDAADLPDDLHPNPEGYRRMGQRYADQVFSTGGVLSNIT